MATQYGCFCEVSFSGLPRHFEVYMNGGEFTGVLKCSEDLIPPLINGVESKPEDYEINIDLITVSSNMRHFPHVTGWTTLPSLAGQPAYRMPIITGDVIYDDGVVGTVSGSMEFTLQVRKKSNINDWAAGTVKLLPSVTVTAVSAPDWPTADWGINQGKTWNPGANYSTDWHLVFYIDGTWAFTGSGAGTHMGKRTGKWWPANTNVGDHSIMALKGLTGSSGIGNLVGQWHKMTSNGYAGVTVPAGGVAEQFFDITVRNDVTGATFTGRVHMEVQHSNAAENPF